MPVDWPRHDATDALSFGSFEFDPHAEELRRDGLRLPVQDMPLKVLAILLERPMELIRREEFFTRLWPDDETGILDDNLNSAIRKLRIALDDSASSPKFIETVPRRGYRFLVEVGVRSDGTRLPPEPSFGLLPSARKPGFTRPDPNRLAHLFVGRDQELATLIWQLEDCIENRCNRLVVISGEAGIGKTRMAEQLAGTATDRAMTVLWGRSLDERGSPPYWPWVQVLRSMIRSSDDPVLAEDMGAGAADIAGIVPELAQRLSLTPSEPLSSAEQGRFRLFDSIACYLARVARRQPLLLVLDNLHWAGRPSLLLLQFLAAALDDSPVLILGTYRGSEVSRRHPLFDALGALNRESGFVRMHLKGLGLDAVEHLIRSATGQTPPTALIEAIHRETEGNAFFIAEVIRLLIDQKVLDSGNVQQRLVIDIPEGIREVIGKRLNQLTEECNTILGRAAVVGRQFDLRLLRAVCEDLKEIPAEVAIDKAVAAGIIVEDARNPEVFRFSHALIRETLYDEIGTAQRSHLHARVGEVLEAGSTEIDDQGLSQLAHHFSEAAHLGDLGKAMHYSLQAAEQAERQLAYEEAANWYQRALEALDLDPNAGDMEMRCRLMLAMARVMSKEGQAAESLELSIQAAEVARQQGHVAGMVEACRIVDYGVSNLGVGGSQALPLVEQTLAELAPGESPEKADLLGVFARAVYMAGRPEQAESAISESIAMSRQVGDAKALASAYRARCFSPYPPESLEQRIEASREMLQLAIDLGDGELERDAHDLCFYDQLELGNLAEADQHLRRSGEVGEAIRQPFYTTNHLVYRAMRAIMEGRYDDGEQLAIDALKAGRRLRRGGAEGLFAMQMFAIRRDQGRLDELRPVLESFRHERSESSAWKPGLALLYAKLDLRDAAREVFESLAAEEFDGVPRDALWSTCLAYLSEVACYLGDTGRARLLYRHLAPYRGRNLLSGASVVFLGAASYYLGLLADCLGEREAARELLQEALELNERMGAQPWLARTRFRLGSLSLDGGGTNASQADLELLQGVEAIARRLGMQRLLEQTVASQRALGGCRPSG